MRVWLQSWQKMLIMYDLLFTLQYCAQNFSALQFFCVNFLLLFQWIRTRHQILPLLIPYRNYFQKILFWAILPLFPFFKPNCAVPLELFLSKEAVAAERRYEKETSTCIQVAFRARTVTLTSPPPPPPPHAIRGRLALCFLPLPLSTHALPMAELCDFQRPRPKTRMASI